jgi:hypothetical protein
MTVWLQMIDWKKVVMDYFKVLFWYLSGGTEENHGKTQIA